MEKILTLLFLFVSINFSFAQQTTTYEIKVVTPKKANAGTNARVYLQIDGSNGSSTDLHLDNDFNNHNQGDIDRYSFEIRDLGEIKSAQLFHDNSENKPGWFCESVTIRNVRTGKVWYFSVNKWFATSHGDGKISRRIYPK